MNFALHNSSFYGGDYLLAEVEEGSIHVQPNLDFLDNEPFDEGWPSDSYLLCLSDPACGACNGTLGLFLLSYGWQLDRARLHLERAVRLDPANSGIRPSLALSLLVTGQLNEALEQIDFALRGAPFQPGYHAIRARTLYFLKRYPEAVDAANRAASLQPNDPAGWEWKSQALIQMGQVERGIEAITARRYPQQADQAMKAARVGGLRAAVSILIGASGDSGNHSWRRARWKALLGNNDGAIAELETAIARKHFEAMFIAVEPVFEPLRDDPRFQILLARAGLRAATPRSASQTKGPAPSSEL